MGRIIDTAAYPYLEKGQPDLAIMEAYKSFYNEIAAEYGWEGAIAPVSPINQSQSNTSDFGIPFPIIMIIVIYIIIRLLSNRGGGGRGGGGGGRYRRRGARYSSLDDSEEAVGGGLAAEAEVSAAAVVDPVAEAEQAAVGSHIVPTDGCTSDILCRPSIFNLY